MSRLRAGSSARNFPKKHRVHHRGSFAPLLHSTIASFCFQIAQTPVATESEGMTLRRLCTSGLNAVISTEKRSVIHKFIKQVSYTNLRYLRNVFFLRKSVFLPSNPQTFFSPPLKAHFSAALAAFTRLLAAKPLDTFTFVASLSGSCCSGPEAVGDS